MELLKEVAIWLVLVLLAPAVPIIILPVIPTVWIGVVFPAFSHFFKRMGVQSFTKRVGLFYLATLNLCLPAVPIGRQMIDDPDILLRVINTAGFKSLVAFTVCTTVFHRQLAGLADAIMQKPALRNFRRRFIVSYLRKEDKLVDLLMSGKGRVIAFLLSIKTVLTPSAEPKPPFD